jgi:hypothetical protein
MKTKKAIVVGLMGMPSSREWSGGICTRLSSKRMFAGFNFCGRCVLLAKLTVNPYPLVGTDQK